MFAPGRNLKVLADRFYCFKMHIKAFKCVYFVVFCREWIWFRIGEIRIRLKIKNFSQSPKNLPQNLFDGNSTFFFCLENLVSGSLVLQVWTEECGIFSLQGNCCGPTAIEGEIHVPP